MSAPPVALWVVGAPGAGKTTAVRALLRQLDPFGAAYLVPKPKWTVLPGVYAAAGHYAGQTFDGADAIPYSGGAAALEHLAAQLAAWAPRAVLLDGDRLSDARALARVGALGLEPRVALLRAEPAVLAARRAARGSTQAPAWAAGRATKAQRFAALFPAGARLELAAGAMPVDAVVAALRGHAGFG